MPIFQFLWKLTLIISVVTQALRNHAEADTWSPNVDVMNEIDLTKKIRDQDRNTRRLRRVVKAW